MKFFKLLITHYDNHGGIEDHEQIDGDDLVEVFSKLLILTAQWQQKWEKRNREYNDDDIPF